MPQDSYESDIQYADCYNPIGHRFGLLTSVSLVRGSRRKNRIHSVLFRCDCGKYVLVGVTRIQRHKVPLGCDICAPPPKPKRHKKTPLRFLYSSEYHTWKKDKSKFCKRWKKSFQRFIEDLGPRPPGKVLIKSSKRVKHGPKHSYWGDNSELRGTKFIHYNGNKYTMVEFCEETGMDFYFVRYHIERKHRTLEELFSRWEEKQRDK